MPIKATITPGAWPSLDDLLNNEAMQAEVNRVWNECLHEPMTLVRELTRPGFAFTPTPDLDPVEAYFAADLIAAE